MNHLQANKWKSAIIEEISIIEENGVWQAVPLLPEANILGSTWVFREKEDHTSKVVRYKAKLCIQGFSQIEGIDYNETYALNGRIASLCFLLSYFAIKNFEHHQMDKTKKKPIVALSTTEDELCALTEVPQDTLWIKKLLYNFNLEPSIYLKCDNQGAIALFLNPLYQHRTRHINIHINWVRDLINSKFVYISYIPTNLMWADLFTKGLGKLKHYDF
ncbi:hypothetical protein O181_008055 [Austropuccinia psidii MF-1]|uniref:Reverse transcriptase Ty1/copia-type domain-containing protein n=1 Tax=Austropuccinia psidii MF-1 TaxID=1389203 RepID=A0A9Q3GII7_9BASI|nr:hypothetical protein [Austropuccinia psidii MF-1]